MELTALTAISPVDGRYRGKTDALAAWFSEFGLIRYRVRIEVEYYIALTQLPLPQLRDFPANRFGWLRDLYREFDAAAAERIKAIERETNHDVKAVEYFIKERFREAGLEKFAEFVHFGLTSQDVNNTAIPLALKDAMHGAYHPALEALIRKIEELADEWAGIPMLARTHGQPASPTKLGKEIRVFSERLRIQQQALLAIPFTGKFGGATGNFNAHLAAYPGEDWTGFAEHFLGEQLGLQRQHTTTQIEHYDQLAALFDAMRRINTILLDLSRDIWHYVSMDYFKQQLVAGEVGSSAMPHKVNPIDFENAEGNIGLANALFGHLSEKLPVSRLQRDLTDSTVTRNIGVPVAHTLVAIASLQKGMGKLLVNEACIRDEVEGQWIVLSEAIQTILRREAYPKPYEALKDLTRNHGPINRAVLHEFIETLDVSEAVRTELKALQPQTYTGNA